MVTVLKQLGFNKSFRISDKTLQNLYYNRCSMALCMFDEPNGAF